MTYVIRYYTVTHMGVDGDYDSLQEARDAYADRREYYDQRGGCIVEGTVEFRDDVKRADAIYD